MNNKTLPGDYSYDSFKNPRADLSFYMLGVEMLEENWQLFPSPLGPLSGITKWSTSTQCSSGYPMNHRAAGAASHIPPERSTPIQYTHVCIFLLGTKKNLRRHFDQRNCSTIKGFINTLCCLTTRPKNEKNQKTLGPIHRYTFWETAFPLVEPSRSAPSFSGLLAFRVLVAPSMARAKRDFGRSLDVTWWWWRGH